MPGEFISCLLLVGKAGDGRTRLQAFHATPNTSMETTIAMVPKVVWSGR